MHKQIRLNCELGSFFDSHFQLIIDYIKLKVLFGSFIVNIFERLEGLFRFTDERVTKKPVTIKSIPQINRSDIAINELFYSSHIPRDRNRSLNAFFILFHIKHVPLIVCLKREQSDK